MVVQYPDKIRITREGGSVQDPDTGDWITTDGEVLEFACRFVPNLQSQEVSLQDGTVFIYHYQIAFPKGTTNILPRDNYVRVSNGESGVIKRFEIGQLHSVAWV